MSARKTPGAEPSGRTVPCPHCRQPAQFAESNRWRPFCSERCRLADLGAWASERFRLPTETSPGEDGTPHGPH